MDSSVLETKKKMQLLVLLDELGKQGHFASSSHLSQTRDRKPFGISHHGSLPQMEGGPISGRVGLAALSDH